MVIAMSKFEHGVSYYTKGTVTLTVYFPEDRTVCQWCPYVRNEDSLRRWRCLLTGEYLVYPFTGIGAKCPIEWEESKDV